VAGEESVLTQFNTPPRQLGIVRLHPVDVLERSVVGVYGHQFRPVIHGKRTDSGEPPSQRSNSWAQTVSAFGSGNMSDARCHPLSEIIQHLQQHRMHRQLSKR